MRRQQLAPCNAAANAPDAAQRDESDILVLEAADDGDDVLMSEDDAPAAPMVGQDDVEDVDQVEEGLAAEMEVASGSTEVLLATAPEALAEGQNETEEEVSKAADLR